MQVHQELKVHQVSQVPWAPQDPLARALLDFLDHRAPLVPLAPPDTPMLVNLALLVPLANPDPLVSLVTEVPLEQLELWAHEEVPEHREHLDLLDFHLLASLALLAFLEQWDQEESLVLRDTLAFQGFLAPKEREASESLVFRDPLVMLDQWAQLECLANLA